MRTTKWNEPELMADDHHGVYMMQLLVSQNKADNTDLWKQIQKQMSESDLSAILEGPDCEWHFEACDSLTSKTFKTKTGQKYSIQYAEGGLWAIPFCFKGQKASEFFGN